MIRYSADFETTTDVNDCRVWAWGVIEIGTEKFIYDTDINSFMAYTFKNNGIYYFHNLGFDGKFILDWLFRNGFTFSRDKQENTFDVIISRANQFYMIEVYLKGKKKVRFLDSYKIIPFSVEAIGKDFKLGIEKLEIDYHQKREIGYQLTEQEIEYLQHDVLIVAKALKLQFDEGLKKMTAGSNALSCYKKSCKRWADYFPIISESMDSYIRLFYRGGFTAVKECEKNKSQGEGLVFDVNSLYPSVMYYELLPYGYPILFDKEYQEDEEYPLYIQHFVAEFKIKKDKIPMIQIKRNPSYIPTDYVTESNEPTELYLTNKELEMFFEHYDVYYYIPLDGMKFKATNLLFREYIDHWMTIKINNSGAVKQLAKLMLNSLYGKFATNPDITGKVPYFDEEKDIVRYKMDEPEFRDPVYTAVGVFITAYGRMKTIGTSQALYDRWLYSDTDSIHIKGLEVPENIDIDQKRLGAWKKESEFTRAKFIRPKTYVEEIDGVLNVKCAGMSDEQKAKCTYDNFKLGLNIESGKLRPKTVRGGVVLEDTSFKMRK